VGCGQSVVQRLLRHVRKVTAHAVHPEQSTEDDRAQVRKDSNDSGLQLPDEEDEEDPRRRDDGRQPHSSLTSRQSLPVLLLTDCSNRHRFIETKAMREEDDMAFLPISRALSRSYSVPSGRDSSHDQAFSCEVPRVTVTSAEDGDSASPSLTPTRPLFRSSSPSCIDLLGSGHVSQEGHFRRRASADARGCAGGGEDDAPSEPSYAVTLEDVAAFRHHKMIAGITGRRRSSVNSLLSACDAWSYTNSSIGTGDTPPDHVEPCDKVGRKIDAIYPSTRRRWWSSSALCTRRDSRAWRNSSASAPSSLSLLPFWAVRMGSSLEARLSRRTSSLFSLPSSPLSSLLGGYLVAEESSPYLFRANIHDDATQRLVGRSSDECGEISLPPLPTLRVSCG